MAVTPWQEARTGARSVRAGLLANDAPDAFASAESLLSAAVKSAGLRVSARPPADPLLSGAHAVLDLEASTIWLRDNATPEERNIYIAHELAHLHLHENGKSCSCDEADLTAGDDPRDARIGYGPRQRRETEANVWAREFLLPVPLAHSLFHAAALTAAEIAARLNVPLSAAYAQLVEGLSSSWGSFAPPAPSGASVPLDLEASLLLSAEPTAIAKLTRCNGTLPPAGSAPPGGAGGAKLPQLDESQQAAAYAAQGPLLVGAGPGTGKTRTLTARVGFLTKGLGVSPDNLLALTFSRKAAEEMRERIAAEDADVARRAVITTFHAYGYDLLRRHGAAAGLPPNPVLLDRAEACALLEKRASTLGLTVLRYLHDPSFPLPDILGMIGRAKEDLITPEEFAARAESSGEPKLADVARVYFAYESLLREKGALDFSDLVCLALRLLTDDAIVRASEQLRWRHILVDEYQDVNRAGALLVQALAGDGGAGLWAVGDLRQAIYRFRGASPANVTRFQSDFPNGQRTDLRVNYRSRPDLVRLFGHISGEGSDTWEAARAADFLDEEATITFAIAADEAAQAEGIIQRIRAFEADGYALGEQAILCRTRGQARALRAQLTAAGILLAPGPDENNLLALPDVKRLLTLLERACEPHGPAIYAWPNLPEGVEPVFGGRDAYAFWTDALWSKAGVARSLADPASVAQLLSLARAFRDREDLLLDSGEQPCKAFLRHLRRLTRMGEALGGRAEPTDIPNAVHVLTVHASKGLEFPVVFVPNLSSGKFPARGGPSLLPPLPATEAADQESAEAEEARLFFVALTRARDHLILSRAAKYNGRFAAPSPLLAALEGAAKVKFEDWVLSPPAPAGGNVPLHRVSFAIAVGSADSNSEASRSSGTLAPEGAGGDKQTTAHDLDLYLRCPRRYYYQRVLELPEGEQSPYAAFKRAVSLALESEEPGVALEAAWALKGPDISHPQEELYRAAAAEIVQRAGRVRRTERSELTVSLPSGDIIVYAEAIAAGGGVEMRTFRRPPNDEEEFAPNERTLSLLQEAAGEVRMRYLQDGRVLPVADRPRQRKNHLELYDGALRGIQLRVFAPAPADASECPNCPYFFICPT